MSANTYLTTRCNFQKDSNFYTHHYENLKSLGTRTWKLSNAATKAYQSFKSCHYNLANMTNAYFYKIKVISILVLVFQTVIFKRFPKKFSATTEQDTKSHPHNMFN